MSARLDSLRPALVLAALGVVALHTVASGQVATLLHPLLHPLVLGAGIVLLAAAVLHAALVGAVPARPRPWRRAARDGAVVLAAVAAVVGAPPSFSALALVNRAPSDAAAALRGKDVADDAAAIWQPAADGTIHLETADLLMAAEHADTVAALTGKKVRFLGQVAPDDGGTFKVVRFLMFCCAADAQPVSVRVEGDAGGIPAMGWAEVVGTVQFPEAVPGKRLPRIALESVRAVPEPANKFLY